MADQQKGKGDKAGDEAKVEAPAVTREATVLPAEEHIANAKEYYGVPSHVVAGGIGALVESGNVEQGALLGADDVRVGIDLFRNHKVKFDGEGAQG
jgi:hypothetical protein